MLLSKKHKTLSEFHALFLKSASSFEHFEKKVTLIAYVFPKLRTTKYVVK